MTNLTRLRSLEKTGLYVFHGSIEKLTTLEPRQAYSNRLPDGPPAVCAATDLDTAIFMALYRGAQFQLSEPSLVKNNDGTYFATRNVLDLVPRVVGYIHVMASSGFSEFRGEQRSTNSVKPIEVLAVTLVDFSYPVSEITIER